MIRMNKERNIGDIGTWHHSSKCIHANLMSKHPKSTDKKDIYLETGAAMVWIYEYTGCLIICYESDTYMRPGRMSWTAHEAVGKEH